MTTPTPQATQSGAATQSSKTLGFVVVAALLVVGAYFSVPTVPAPEQFNEVGELFFPGFTDHSKATALTIVEHKSTGEQQFRVERKDNVWKIPSHHDYPADATERMGKAAAVFIGLKKDDFHSDSVDEHGKFGVLDPSDAQGDADERGMLVTFEDVGQNKLASLIVGDQIEGKEHSYYVRLPGKKQVYATRLPAEISAEFKDWIESDLLNVSSYNIQSLNFDNYSIDEETGSIDKKEQEANSLAVSKVGGEWAMLGLAENEELDSEAINEVGRTLDDLKIVGVRKKPEGLSAQLTREEGITRMSQQLLFSMQMRGFYMANDGNLYANEGDLIAKTDKGVVYTLRFGEILVGSGDDLTAGSEKEGQEKSDATVEEGLTANRFLMVTVDFDPDLLDQPKGLALPSEHMDKRGDARSAVDEIVAAIEKFKNDNDGTLPTSLTQLTEGDAPPLATLAKDPWEHDYGYVVDPEGGTYQVICYGEDGAEGGEGVNLDLASNALAAEDQLEKNFDEFKAFQEKVKEGEELVGELRARFAPWYYVIDDESFKKLRRSRGDVVKPKGAATTQPGQ